VIDAKARLKEKKNTTKRGVRQKSTEFEVSTSITGDFSPLLGE
jgi:Sec7-like guanine-nucleotide exchange factor